MKLDLEVVKMQMDENIQKLVELQEMQLKAYEDLMKITNIDEIDSKILELEEEFKYNTLLSEIKITEKENFKNLIKLAWDKKYKEGEGNV